MIALKLKIEELPDEMLVHMREYNKLSRCIFNLMNKRGCDHKEAVKIIEKSYSYNKDIIDNTILLDHIGIKTDMLFKANKVKDSKSVIFGSKSSWKKLHKGLITKEQFDEKRNLTGCLYTGKAASKGNGKWKLDSYNNQILFKPKRGIVIPIKYKTSKKRQREIEKIQKLAESKLIPYAIKVSHNSISILVDESKISEYEASYVKNRIAAFDANPNINAITIIQYDGGHDGKKEIVYKEVSNLFQLKSSYNSNKIKYELNCEAKRIVKVMRHYNVEVFGYEDLEMSGDTKKGKKFNRMVNNDWKRNHFLKALLKWCNIYKIKTQKILAHYSSTIGCLQNPDETDSVAASIELNRRTYIFHNRFINKLESFVDVDVIYPPFNREMIQERWNSIVANFKGKMGWVSLHNHIKQQKSTSLRFLYQSFDFKDWISFRPSSEKSLIMVHAMHGKLSF